VKNASAAPAATTINAIASMTITVSVVTSRRHSSIGRSSEPRGAAAEEPETAALDPLWPG
jgi:hypothetical protein